MTEQEKSECQLFEENPFHDSEIRWEGILSGLCLQEENKRFANSPGISINNRNYGFLPAFQNSRSGCCIISRFADGRPAPVHILDGLPDEWIEAREPGGQVIRACPQIISGFLRNGRFYTREEVSQATLNQDDTLI